MISNTSYLSLSVATSAMVAGARSLGSDVAMVSTNVADLVIVQSSASTMCAEGSTCEMPDDVAMAQVAASA